MRLPEFIIKMLRKKSGNDLYLPSDCEFLSLDIESNLGIHIGATTLNEYRKNIESDGALERRFQKVMIEPTTAKETLTILQNIKFR